MEFLRKLKKKWQTVTIITLIVAGAVFSVSAFLPPQYGSEVSILVIQKQPSDKVDAFSAAKSAEYLSDILAKVVYTESFVQNVVEAPFDTEINFPSREKEKRQYWKDKVEVDKVNNTGIINITVYDKNRENAEKIAESIAWAYNVRGARYHGGGERVEIKKIDGPMTPVNPMKPNILLNTLLGVILGLVGSVAVVYFFEDFELNLFPGRGKSDDDEDERGGKSFRIPFNLRKSDEKENFQLDNYVFPDGEVGEKKEAKKETETEDGLEQCFDYGEGNAIEIKEPYSFEGEVPFLGEEKAEQKEETEKTKDNVPDSTKKNDSPGNLPVFEGDMSEFFSVEFNGKQEQESQPQEKSQKVDKQAQEAYNKESSENEVKDKLNKLLRGEM